MLEKSRRLTGMDDISVDRRRGRTHKRKMVVVMTTAESATQQPADVFVIFGITGDLAKVMTFRSLYRLEARGLLQCPIVGVAVDDWTVDQLVRTRTRVDRGNR